MADEFVFMGAVKDNSPYATQKARVDKRLIREVQKNFTLDSGQEIILLDAKERGDLFEILVVADNPYLEVFLEMDDWRNDNASAAEILAQPETGRLLSNFQAIDGGHPGVGYTLLYNPDVPEDYDGRLRVVLRNRIRPNKDVFGDPKGRGPYVSRGDLATPSEMSWGGGFVINSQVGAAISNLSIEELAYSISGSTNSDFLMNPGIGNTAFNTPRGLTLKRGALHPYVGTAGRPTFALDTIGNGSGTTVHVFWDNPLDIEAATAKSPGWPGAAHQDIYLVDFAGGALTTTVAVGDRVWVRSGNRNYFPGAVTALATNQNLPTKFASNGGVAYTGSIKISVTPGMRAAPPSSRIRPIAGGSQAAISSAGFGTLTTNADSNPQILVKHAEIKRLKRVSYDG